MNATPSQRQPSLLGTWDSSARYERTVHISETIADLLRRIITSRASITDSEHKQISINQAIRLRRATLQPLEAEVVQNEAVLSSNHDGL
jgi:hypothetical protein